MERLVRLSEAAQVLGVTPQTLRRWGRRGLVKLVRLPGGELRVGSGQLAFLTGEESEEQRGDPRQMVLGMEGKEKG